MYIDEKKLNHMVVLGGDKGGMFLCSDQPIRSENKVKYAHRIVKLNNLFNHRYIMDTIPFITKAALVEESDNGKHRIKVLYEDTKNKTYRYKDVGSIPLTSLIALDNDLVSFDLAD